MRHARGLASTEHRINLTLRCEPTLPQSSAATYVDTTHKQAPARCPSQPHGRDSHTSSRHSSPTALHTVTHGIIPSLVRPSYYTATGVRGHPTSDRMRTRQDARPAGAQGRRKGSAPTISALSISPAPARAAAPSCRQITRRTQPPSPSPDSHWHRPAPLPHLQHTLAPSVSTASQHAASAHTHTREFTDDVTAGKPFRRR